MLLANLRYGADVKMVVVGKFRHDGDVKVNVVGESAEWCRLAVL